MRHSNFALTIVMLVYVIVFVFGTIFIYDLQAYFAKQFTLSSVCYNDTSNNGEDKMTAKIKWINESQFCFDLMNPYIQIISKIVISRTVCDIEIGSTILYVGVFVSQLYFNNASIFTFVFDVFLVLVLVVLVPSTFYFCTSVMEAERKMKVRWR